MGSLRHGEAECTQLADRGQFPHIRAPPGRANAPSRALPFSSDDFFAAVRAVYNARPDDPEYERLSICLLGVAQPGDLIRNEQITPFNIGTRIDLADFERPQLAPLESGLSATGANPVRLLDAVFDWTCGHPYMVQSLCAALVPAPDRPQHIPQGTEAAHIATLVERWFLQRSGGRNPNLDYAEKCFQRGDTDPRVAKLDDKGQQDFVKKFVAALEKENAAYDIGGYKAAPPGLRIWCGATVDTADLQKLTPWLDSICSKRL